MKYLCAAGIIFFAMSVHAQVNKGGFLVSGNLGFNHQKDTPSDANRFTYNVFSIDSKVGYFLFSRFCVGVSVPFSTSKSQSVTTSGTQTLTGNFRMNSLGVGPFVRYYYPLKQKLFAVGEASYAWTSYHSDNSSESFDGVQYVRSVNKSNDTQKLYQLGAGLSYFANRNVGVELLASYRKYEVAEIHTKNFQLRIGLQIYLGR